MGQAFGLCPKCLKMRSITRHHLHPKRYFKRSKAILHLCRQCHNELEYLITDSEINGKMEKKHYVQIAIDFLRGGNNE